MGACKPNAHIDVGPLEMSEIEQGKGEVCLTPYLSGTHGPRRVSSCNNIPLLKTITMQNRCCNWSVQESN